MTVVEAIAAALALLPAGTVLRVVYRGQAAAEPSEYVGELMGYGGDSFTLRTAAGPRRFLARVGRLFAVDVVRLGAGRAA